MKSPTIPHHRVIIKCLAPRQLKTDLEHLAEARNISLSALLRLILTEYIKQKSSS